MRAFRVVIMNGLLSGLRGGEEVRKPLVQQILQFQNAIHSFCHGIVIGVAHLAHARADACVLYKIQVRAAGVL